MTFFGFVSAESYQPFVGTPFESVGTASSHLLPFLISRMAWASITIRSAYQEGLPRAE